MTSAGSGNLFPSTGQVASLIRSKDWTTTELGPPESWSPGLRSILRLMLTSRYAMWLGWGPELAFFYNDAYREQTLGSKHPWALGRPASVVWAEIWDQIYPRIRHVLDTGEATWDEGLLLFLERSGYPEETYHTFSYSPALDDEGIARGLFCVVIEETERVVGARRIALLRDYASELSRAQTAEEVFRATERTLAKSSRDLTFALAYLFDGGEPSDARPAMRTGIDEALAASLSWPLAELRSGSRPIEVVLPEREGSVWPTGPWKRSSERALAIPIGQAGQSVAAGVLIAGINPHRPLDEAYKSFLELFVGQLAAGLDNARAYELERKRAEALAQIDRAKTAFFSNVSHEFRTPLTLMLGPTEDALASPERTLRGESLDVVHRNELRLLKLVNALLDFSRMEAGRVEANYEETDLAALTRELASAFESAMERGKLRYDVDCRPLREPVWIDHEMWEKIVLNLLSNALKFTMEGYVRVALCDRGRAVELVVEDTGVGVPEAELPRMFERFHRIEGTPARTQEGSGIGLALVRDLVELHGGSIAVASVLGRGTTFTVTIPKGREHLPADRIVHRRRETRLSPRAESFVAEALRWVPDAGPREEAPPSELADGSRELILVADDNADMREYIARLLRERWRVETVNDGNAALEAVRRHAPDLVVSDVMMPGLDGFAFVQRVRADPATRTLPIILLSARAGEEATADGLRSGANDYVIKPFSARELVVRISSQLAIARIRREAEAGKEAQRQVVERLFEHAPAGIALLRGEEHVIEFANPMALSIWGRKSDVVGKPLLDALPELRGQGFDHLLREVMRTGAPYVGDDVPVILDRDGRRETLYLKFVYAPAVNEQGVVDGVAAFGFDVTSQVVARQRATLGATLGRVLASGADLATQLRSCCEAIVAFGATLAALWTYNDGHDVLELRASAGAPTPPPGWERVPVGDRSVGIVAQRREPYVTSSVASDPILRGDAWLDNGRIVGFAAYPLCVRERLLGVVAIGTDRALDDVVLETLATASDQIAIGIDRENSERFRELFIGMLGHDLRNPLNAVNMATHVLAAGELTPQQMRAIERVRASVGRMSRMIAQVLDFTRARAGGGIPIARAEADVHAICAHVIAELATANPTRQIDAVYLGSGTGSFDADRLAQVFSNVIGNALTYGRVDAPVRVELDGTAATIVCSIHNDGPPIPASLRSWLFDPFRRAAHGKAAGTHGLGLGLFIAHQIVLAHEGSIVVRSSEEEGTEFRIAIPRRPRERT